MQADLKTLEHRYTQLRQKMGGLATCPDGDVPDMFTDLLGSLEQLFAVENHLMETHQFPARRSHLEQHARVLGGLHRTHSRVMGGACQQGRYAATHLLMHWFELHNNTLDACLAVWLESAQSLAAGRRSRRADSEGDGQLPGE